SEYHASESVRNLVALSDDGVLYVVDGAERELLVMSYMSRITRAAAAQGRVAYTEKRVISHTELRQLYAAHAADTAVAAVAATSDRRTLEQNEAMAFLKEAVEVGASDVDITTIGTAAVISYRVAGDVEARFRLSAERAQAVIRTIIDSMCVSPSDPQYDPTRDQSARLSRPFIEQLGVSQVRVQCGPLDDDGTHMTLRLQPMIGVPQPLTELGYSPSHQSEIEHALSHPYGLVLFSGATGSGKTTALANVCGHVLAQHGDTKKALELADPPELGVPGILPKAITRRGHGREAEELAWVMAFETALRWKPDWILPSELRLKAAMHLAMAAAISGHLTLSTIHAARADAILDRLNEAGIEMSYLTDVSLIRLLVNQSLAPVLCPHCAIPYRDGAATLPPQQRRRIEQHCTVETVRLRNPHGCASCMPALQIARGATPRGHGRRGVIRERTVCAEVIQPTARDLQVYRAHGAFAMRRNWVRAGGRTKTAHLIEKINAGLVCPTDGERAVALLDEDSALWEDET
uniref:ATPase, T2SS/T4P/T4SS family n=1 Tax=uncultured Pigmentiphaga sp. TaxID=340361 RepID=UPI002606EC48